MSLPDSGQMAMSSVATQLGVSTTNISLSGLGGTASSGYTSNVYMSYFFTPIPPGLSYDSGLGQVTVTVVDSWPAGSTYSFYRTIANGSSAGPYTAKATDQSSTTFIDSTVLAGKSYWWKVSIKTSTFGREGLDSDPAQIICS